MSKYNQIITGNESENKPMIHEARFHGTNYKIDYALMGNAPTYYKRELGPFIVENQRFSGSNWSDEFPTIDKALYAGDTYIVTLDGEDYECVAEMDEEGEDTVIRHGDDFIIYSTPGNWLEFEFCNYPEQQYHILSIRRVIEERKPLDRKLMPVLYSNGETAFGVIDEVALSSLSQLSFMASIAPAEWEQWSDGTWICDLEKNQNLVNRFNLLNALGLIKSEEPGEPVDYEEFLEEHVASVAVNPVGGADGTLTGIIADGLSIAWSGIEEPNWLDVMVTVTFNPAGYWMDWNEGELLPSHYVTPSTLDLKTVRYYSEGELIMTEKVAAGGRVAGEIFLDPIKEPSGSTKYYFTGWSLSPDATESIDLYGYTVDTDLDLYAVFQETTRRSYTVTWRNFDPNYDADASSYPSSLIIAKQTVLEGDVPIIGDGTIQNPDLVIIETDEETGVSEYIPVNPNGGTFISWDKDIEPAYSNRVYVATYEHTVRFYDDTDFLQETTVKSGGTAPFQGSLPKRDGKQFSGWNPTADQVNGNLTCFAKFSPVVVPVVHTVDKAYAVEWNYGDPATTLTRKGLASSFGSPSPATALDGTGSSPFDTIMPWAGMKRYNVIDGKIVYSQSDEGFSETDYDTVVYIPEFYYTVKKDAASKKWLWAISPKKLDGYAKHPGSGRYVGRFKMSGGAEDVYTKAAQMPISTRAGSKDARTYSHDKGDNWALLDYQTWFAIQLLYLVEFADFNSQEKLGKGVNGTAFVETGASAGAAYHTVKGETFNQYRWIENPFSNGGEILDGIFAISNASYSYRGEVYVAPDTQAAYDTLTNFQSYMELEGHPDFVKTGLMLPNSGNTIVISDFGYSDYCPFGFIPVATVNDAENATYTTDNYTHRGGLTFPIVGMASGFDSLKNGFFAFMVENTSTYATTFSARLIYIPKE